MGSIWDCDESKPKWVDASCVERPLYMSVLLQSWYEYDCPLTLAVIPSGSLILSTCVEAELRNWSSAFSAGLIGRCAFAGSCEGVNASTSNKSSIPCQMLLWFVASDSAAKVAVELYRETFRVDLVVAAPPRAKKVEGRDESTSAN